MGDFTAGDGALGTRAVIDTESGTDSFEDEDKMTMFTPFEKNDNGETRADNPKELSYNGSRFTKQANP